MTSEIFTERLHLALESTRGTAVTTPTHTMNGVGLLTPGVEYYEPAESRGEIARVYQQLPIRKTCAWSFEGPGDVNYLPVWLQMAVAPNTSPSTPGGATNSRLWEFVRDMDADDLKAATLIWDLDAQSLVSDFSMLDTLTLENDGAGTGGMTVNIAGMTGFPADIATPTPAANIAGALLPGLKMQLWLDTSSAIGTTAVTGRLLKAKHEIKTGVTYKFVAAGPTAGLDFVAVGRDPAVARCVTTLTLEVPDMTQYDLFADGTSVKCRVRHNGSLIESTFYNYVEVDTYGVMKNLAWNTNVNSNRTVEFTIESVKDSTLGADFRVAVQNARTALA